jgi:hypothetical protein
MEIKSSLALVASPLVLLVTPQSLNSEIIAKVNHHQSRSSWPARATGPSRKNEEKSHAKTQRTRLSQVLDGSRLLPTGRSSNLRRLRDSSPPNLSSSFCDLCAFSRLFRFFCLRLCVRFFGAAGNFRDLGASAANFCFSRLRFKIRQKRFE